MRIETHGDTVSFDGGTMSRKEALAFALQLANAAWMWEGAWSGQEELTFTTVSAAVAMEDIHSVLSIYGNTLHHNPKVAEIRRDRLLAEMCDRSPEAPGKRRARR